MQDFITLMFSVIYSVKMIMALAILFIFLLGLFLPIFFLFYRRKLYNQRAKNHAGKTVVGFFHPYCNSGGGGEKVLWAAIQALQKKYPKAEFYIYTGDVEVTPGEILHKVNKNLNLDVDKSVKFVYLNKRRWVEASMYPYFTLLGQALGSMYLGFEAIKKLNPDIYIDTTGFSFTLPIFKYLGQCKTGSYVHYPIITKDMLRRVSNREAIYNNRGIIARSPFLTTGKLLYYQAFAWAYSLAGYCSDMTMVNSTFTLEHLTLLWNKSLHLVYPPCEVEHLKNIPRAEERPEKIRILSLAQFRPEKDHPLQLQTLYELRELVSEELFSRITLVLCGSCRNQEDNVRVKDLKDLSKYFSLENHVEFKVNVPYDELLEEFKNAYIGIHTMLDEHFGISVVEQMAAGLIMVAHRSGGPLLDIIETSEGSRLGFLALTADQFAFTIKFILDCNVAEINAIRERARASVDRFSLTKFQDEFLRAVDPLFK